MISVLIPAYNAEKTIEACLDSVLTQTFQGFEVVVINDGSTDATAEILNAYAEKDTRIRVFHQENAGVSAARNRAVLESCGEEITFLDADDRLLPAYLEVLHNAKKKTGVVCVCCNHYVVYKGIRHKRFEEPTEFTLLSAHEALFGMLYHRVPDVSPWGKLYSRELLQKIHCPEGRIFEDSYVIADILIAAEQIGFVAEPLYEYVWRDTSISKSRNDPHLWDYYEAVNHMTNVVEQAYPEFQKGCVRRRSHAIMSMMRVLDPKLHKTDWRKARRLLRQSAWTVLTDKDAPKRDKLGILAALPGHWCYWLLWRLYTKHRASFY